MALMEADEVAIEKSVWTAAKGGDEHALNKIRDLIDGLVIYFHALSLDDNTEYALVTLGQLEELHVIDCVTIKARRPGVQAMWGNSPPQT